MVSLRPGVTRSQAGRISYPIIIQSNMDDRNPLITLDVEMNYEG